MRTHEKANIEGDNVNLPPNLSYTFRYLSPDSRELLQTAGTMIEVDIMNDPTYSVATDVLA